MTSEEVQTLKHGLYLVHWKNGGRSLAAVGSKYDGSRWICCTNWTSAEYQGTDSHSQKIWNSVLKVGVIAIDEKGNFKND